MKTKIDLKHTGLLVEYSYKTGLPIRTRRGARVMEQRVSRNKRIEVRMGLDRTPIINVNIPNIRGKELNTSVFIIKMWLIQTIREVGGVVSVNG